MTKSKLSSIIVICLLLVGNMLFGFSNEYLANRIAESRVVDGLYLALKDPHVVDEQRSMLPTLSGRAQAANFSIQTGYYVGSGGSQSISSLGFQPQAVIIKADTAAGQGVWKTNAMPANATAFFAATANNTASLITLNASGFSVAANANTNSANVRYKWIAFAGSDCSASGTMCIGTYTGNGSNPRKITTGFQPAYVMAKRSTAVGANFRTNSMPNNTGNYFTNVVQNTSGGLFTTFVSDGFNVGSAVNNVSGGLYYYVAFKSVPGTMAEGVYTGNGADNRNITGFGVGAVPNFAFVKNANSSTSTNRLPYFNTTHSYGDQSSRFSTATANSANVIQQLQDDGLQVGTGAYANQSGNTIYWVAFGGAPPPPAAAGTFDMATGSYLGNGTSQSITGLGFAPDLIVIKDSSANQSVFRTSLMASNNTAYLSGATANFAGGITSLDATGFSVGASTVVNGSGSTYHWQAFGNAYDPSTGSGASDFAVGVYMGNNVDNRNITGLPFQPDMITIKRSGTSFATWRSSAHSGDSSGFFGATAEGANRVQSLQPLGYQIGRAANVNSNNNLYNWFAFKQGDNFRVGSYTGTASPQDINVGFQPDLVWVKGSSNSSGVHRASSLVGDTTQFFTAAANTSNRITGVACNVFSVGGNQTETNASGGTYRYAAWRAPNEILGVDIVDGTGCGVDSPSFSLPESNFSFSCTSNVSLFGTADQRMRVTNTTPSPGWSLSIAATDGPTALWRNGGNTEQFDFNDSSGCADGIDSDGRPGQLSFDPSGGINTPQAGCASTNINFGNSAGFQEGLVDAITLLSASAGAQTGCYWDITNIGLSQYIPGAQRGGDTYNINLTLTVTAF